MFRVGDRVLHIEYPNEWGKVVAKKRKNEGLQFVLVEWDNNRGRSRHHATALRHAPRPQQDHVTI